MNEKDILTWIETFADDVTYIRGVRGSVRVEVTFCHPNTGCQVTRKGSSLRDVVTKVANSKMFREVK